MNIYDAKLLKCISCGKYIGEVSFDAIIGLAKCGQCGNTNSEKKRIEAGKTSGVFFAAAL
jgi:phage FluMu protein Com